MSSDTSPLPAKQRLFPWSGFSLRVRTVEVEQDLKFYPPRFGDWQNPRGLAIDKIPAVSRLTKSPRFRGWQNPSGLAVERQRNVVHNIDSAFKTERIVSEQYLIMDLVSVRVDWMIDAFCFLTEADWLVTMFDKIPRFLKLLIYSQQKSINNPRDITQKWLV
jgi:hypothetical protein